MLVKCRECGYLALRSLVTRQLFEVEEATRETGTLPQDQAGAAPGGIYPPYMLLPPVCFRMVSEFRQQTKKIKNGDDKPFFNIIDAERECVSFTEWRHGWTPREHWEMNQAAEMQSLKDRMAVQEKTAASQEGESLRRVAQFEKTLSAQQTDFENRMKWYALVIAVAGLSWAIYKEAAPTTPPLSPPVVNVTTPAPVVNISFPTPSSSPDATHPDNR